MVGLHCSAGFSPAARRGAALWLWGEDLSPRWIAVFLPLTERRLWESGSWALERSLSTCGSGLSGTEELTSGSQRRTLCGLDVAPGSEISTVRNFLSPYRTLLISADIPPPPTPGALNGGLQSQHF